MDNQGIRSVLAEEVDAVKKDVVVEIFVEVEQTLKIKIFQSIRSYQPESQLFIRPVQYVSLD